MERRGRPGGDEERHSKVKMAPTYMERVMDLCSEPRCRSVAAAQLEVPSLLKCNSSNMELQLEGYMSYRPTTLRSTGQAWLRVSHSLSCSITKRRKWEYWEKELQSWFSMINQIKNPKTSSPLFIHSMIVVKAVSLLTLENSDGCYVFMSSTSAV